MLAIERKITHILADGGSFTAVSSEILRVLGDFFEAGVAELWVPDVDQRFLRRVEFYAPRPGSHPHFQEKTVGMRFPLGVGLPGRVWESRQPIAIANLSKDPNFSRAGVAAADGLSSGVAFPIVIGDDFCGVIQFFTSYQLSPEPSILSMMAAIGSEIGQFIRRQDAERVLKENEERYRSVINTVVDGIVTINAGGVIESFNPAAEEIFGFSADELIGRNVTILMPEPYRSSHGEFVRRYLRTGEKRVIGIGREVVGQRKDGTTFPLELSISEFKLAGKPMFTGVIRDITERKRVEEELSFLAQASRLLGESLDFEATLALVADLVVPVVADWCFISLADDDEEEPTVVVKHSDPEKVKRLEEMRRLYPFDPGDSFGVAKVMRTGRMELYPEITEKLLQEIARDDDHLRRLQELELRSAVIVPLEARGQRLGTLTLISSRPNRHTLKKLGLVEELARRCALAVDNAKLFREAQREIQERRQVEKQLQDLNETLEERIIERTARLRSLALELGEAEQRERQRLAQVLHDDLQPLLAAAAMKTEMVREKMEPEKLATILGQVEDMLHQSLLKTRNLSVDLSPPVLSRSGLCAALKWLGEDMQKKHDLQVEVRGVDVESRVDGLSGLLFQSVRELLFNVAKHSGSSRASLKLWQEDPFLIIRVEDRGKGFDPSILDDNRQPATFGLFSIRERLTAVGGKLDIESSPGQGCRVILRVPRVDLFS